MSTLGSLLDRDRVLALAGERFLERGQRSAAEGRVRAIDEDDKAWNGKGAQVDMEDHYDPNFPNQISRGKVTGKDFQNRLKMPTEDARRSSRRAAIAAAALRGDEGLLGDRPATAQGGARAGGSTRASSPRSTHPGVAPGRHPAHETRDAVHFHKSIGVA